MKETSLIFLVILVVLAISVTGFLFLKNSGLSFMEQPSHVCDALENPSTGLPCKEAIGKALKLYPGKANSIQLTTTKFQEGPTGTPQDIEIWLVDISLENPAETEVGPMARVTVGVDTSSAIEPFIQEFFPETL